MISSFGDVLGSTYEQMSLLDFDEIDEAEMERISLYQECYETHNWRNCMVRTFARVLTQLVAGEHFSRIKLRFVDAVDLTYELSISSFVEDSSQRLDKIAVLMGKYVKDRELAVMTLRD